MPIPIEERIQKYQAWRERRPQKRPLLGLLWEPDIPPLPEMLAQVGIGNEVLPARLEADLFTPSIEDWYRQDCLLEGDAIQPFTPAFGLPWVEAIAGCPVIAHPGSLWAEPALKSYQGRPPIRLEQDNPWLVKLVEFVRSFVKFSAGRFPVALPQMRGPLDTLAALRTPAQMCIDFLEEPEEVSRILGELTELWIGIARIALAEIPPFYGGYSTRMKMWAPGKAVNPQNDVSTLISPRLYRDVVFPWDQKIHAQFPFHSFHMHSTEYRHIPTLVASDLTAIQFTLDQGPGEQALDKMVAEAERIRAGKPLILVPLDLETAEICLERLPAAGLALMPAISTPYIPDEFSEWLAKKSRE